MGKCTVARYTPRQRPRSRPPSQTWGTFVRNHLPGTLAIDFLTVPTATFGVLYVFFVLSLERRRVLHVNVAAQPFAASAAQQMIEAVSPDVLAERVICDRDGIFGVVFDKRLAGMPLEQFRIAPRAPWQNGFAERFVGTITRAARSRHRPRRAAPAPARPRLRALLQRRPAGAGARPCAVGVRASRCARSCARGGEARPRRSPPPFERVIHP